MDVNIFKYLGWKKEDNKPGVEVKGPNKWELHKIEPSVPAENKSTLLLRVVFSLFYSNFKMLTKISTIVLDEFRWLKKGNLECHI